VNENRLLPAARSRLALVDDLLLYLLVVIVVTLINFLGFSEVFEGFFAELSALLA